MALSRRNQESSPRKALVMPVRLLEPASAPGLGPRVLDRVLADHPRKNIAADLGISQRTVDNHRAAIMWKTGSKSLPALIRTVLAAG
jgi:FixJ family two-component response regulator